MVEVVAQILRIQEADQKIAALNSEIAALPKHIAEIERQLDSHIKKLEADRAALAANQRERKQRDLDIGTQQQKISKLRDQMLQAKTNEQYRAFQHEIEFCENEIRKAEDRILELMSEAEPLDVNVKAAEAALAVEKSQVETEKAQARERTAADKAALAEATSSRQALFAALPVMMQRQVDRLKKKHANGVIVAEATSGVCTGCRLQFRPQFFQDLKKSTEVMFCESCGRILRYDPPTDVQAQFEGGTRVALS
jgi:predicted  nucleic acid-binding Zn-ribbon protein